MASNTSTIRSFYRYYYYSQSRCFTSTADCHRSRCWKSRVSNNSVSSRSKPTDTLATYWCHHDRRHRRLPGVRPYHCCLGKTFSTTTSSTTSSLNEHSSQSQSQSSYHHSTVVVDNDPYARDHSHDDRHHHYDPRKRLPQLNFQHYNEFPLSAQSSSSSSMTSPSERHQYILRITRMAIDRVLEPPTIHLLAAAACAALGVAAVEGYLLCQHPFSNPDALSFILRYSIEQLFPSVVWSTNDAHLVATAMNLDPTTLLKDMRGTTPESASLLLQIQLLQSSRHFWAGFMMIAQFIRAASISFDTVKEYERRIQLGQEPPFLSTSPFSLASLRINSANNTNTSGGLVVRLCGVRSHVSEVSLGKMGTSSFFPVFEEPTRIQFLVQKYSKAHRVPVYWCVPSGSYGASYSWDGFPTDRECLITGQNEQDKILVLEADATNGNDPLALGEAALDLTIDDASQGFRRIIDQYYTKAKLIAGKDFRTLRVYLGNSMEVQTTGGGHKYTLRHRVRYAREVDVLVDSRAPVLKKVLEWCESVASKDRAIFFQTSSREYFLSLKRLLEQYGYNIYDPLDLRAMKLLPDDNKNTNENQDVSGDDENLDKEVEKCQQKSFLSVLLHDEEFIRSHIRDWEENALFLHGMMISTQNETGSKSTDIVEMANDDENNDKKNEKIIFEQEDQKNILRSITKMASLPRLVHMRTTAETVNAVEALVMAGEVNASNCCALIDRKEGVQALERTLRRETKFVQESNQSHQWSFYKNMIPQANSDGASGANNTDDDDDDDDDEDNPDRTVTTGGLQIICSSSIHDNLFRQCRQWARMGYTPAEIQSEFDAQYVDLLRQIHTVQQQVKEVVTKEPQADSTSSKDDGSGTATTNNSKNNAKEGKVSSPLIDVE